VINETVATVDTATTAMVESVVRITAELRRFGFTEDEIRWVGSDEVDEVGSPALVA